MISIDGGKTFSVWPQKPVKKGPVWEFVVKTTASEIRISKYFPYTLKRLDAFLQKHSSNPNLKKLPDYGTSWLGTPLKAYSIGTGKRKVTF